MMDGSMKVSRRSLLPTAIVLSPMAVIHDDGDDREIEVNRIKRKHRNKQSIEWHDNKMTFSSCQLTFLMTSSLIMASSTGCVAVSGPASAAIA